MRVPISWLRDYVDIELSADALAERITNAGMEVTTIERIGTAGAPLVWQRDKVLLARLLAVRQHPDADRLVIASVDHGADQPKEVVTGAPNLFPFVGREDLATEDLFSPLVLEGAEYHDPYKDGKITKLKGKELRGVYNDAMLCSPVELGLGDDHDGILLVPGRDLPGGTEAAVAGRPLVDVLGDEVLDVDIIPNIARCASMVGIAREVAALTGKTLRLPSLEVQQDGDSLAGRLVIEAEEPELNPRFVAFLVEGVQRGPAPFWMQHRLRLAGQRPLGVVVDISNYVMLELGQPNHTFDWDFLRQRADGYAPSGPVRIVTRLARPGETLTTLDGVTHELLPNNVLVTDPAGNLSLGGIMGGHESEIQDDTTNVLLEAAAWKFTNIRQTQRQLGLHTEAGFRFSRGVHPEQAMVGARRAAELLRILAGGTVARGCVDHVAQPWPEVSVELDANYVNQLSGLELTAEEIGDLLARLEFRIEPLGTERLRVAAPQHRLDIEGPHDLLEEVCRMVGYENLPSTVLASRLPKQRGNPELEFEEAARDQLVRLGLHEVITYRLTTRAAEARLRDPVIEDLGVVELANPSTQDRSTLRRSLLASVLDVAAANRRFRDRLALFEIGSVFWPRGGEVLPGEPARLVLVLSGPRDLAHWNQADRGPFDFFDLKGVLQNLLGSLGIAEDLHFCAIEHPTYRPGAVAELRLGEREVGRCGELHPLVAESWQLQNASLPVFAADLDFTALTRAGERQRTIEPLPVYPAIREDLAFVVAQHLPAAELEQALRQAGGKLLEAVELFDLYEGDNVDEGKKSLAYRLTYRSASKTLRDKDAKKLRQRLVRAAEQVGAQLRDS